MRHVVKAFVLGSALAALMAAPVLAAKPIGPNPFPAVSRSVCEGQYGGFFSEDNSTPAIRSCVVTTNDTLVRSLGQSDKSWTLVLATVETYTFNEGTRTYDLTGTRTCTNPGGKVMTNDWIKPCTPPFYA